MTKIILRMVVRQGHREAGSAMSMTPAASHAPARVPNGYQ